MRWLRLFGLGLAGLFGAVVLGVAGFVAWHWAPDVPRAELEARWAPPPSQFVEVAGFDLHVRDEGTRDDPLPFVLLHGTSDSLHAWDGWAAGLVADRRRVIRLDLPGFGLTGPPAEGLLTMARNRAAVLGLMDALGVERAILGGNSFGARLAWTIAAEAPGRVGGLVLVASSGLAEEPAEVPAGFVVAGWPGVRDVLRNTLPRFLLRMSLESVYGDPARLTEAEVDRFFDITVREGNRDVLFGRYGGIEEEAGFGPAEAVLAGIAAPTLLIWGSEDRLVPPSAAGRFAAVMPDAEAVVLRGLGHVPHSEDPEATLAVVRAWVARRGILRPAPEPPR